jgi:short-subunit dehydrogenase
MKNQTATMKDCAGKTVLVTGASTGIGRLIAEKLARHRIHLLLAGRDALALHETKARIVAAGGTANVVVADLLEATGRETIVAACQRLSGGLYGLVNNAGCSHFALLAHQTDTMIQDQIQLNLLVPVLLTRALLPALEKEQEARVLNIGSTFGSIGYPGYSTYCASKFGLRGFTEALRRELADTNMKVLYFAPRATLTRLNPDRVVQMNHALGNKMDTADDVATKAVTIFLAGHPHNAYMGHPENLFARINQMFPAIVSRALKKQLAIIKRYATTTQDT